MIHDRQGTSGTRLRTHRQFLCWTRRDSSSFIQFAPLLVRVQHCIFLIENSQAGVCNKIFKTVFFVFHLSVDGVRILIYTVNYFNILIRVKSDYRRHSAAGQTVIVIASFQ